MSEWKEGKITTGCTLAQLKRALMNIKKDWRIQTVEDPDAVLDSKGGITAMTAYHDARHPHKQGQQLVLRMGHGGVRGADIGFTKNPDGTWHIDYDNMPDGVDNLDGAVKGAIARIRIKQAAAKKKYQEVTDTMSGEDRVMRYLAPAEDLAGKGFGI